MKDKIYNIINRYLFLILVLLLITFEIFIISKGAWYHDFWEHSAVVNELSKHLMNPNNPIIKTTIPHAFFTPYSLLVAIFSKITNQNSIQSLEYFAFFNLLFFLLAFYLFCKNISGEYYSLFAAFSLIFILFFWGKDPWIWSGFYHIWALPNMLSYPSTFAMSLSLLILSIVVKNQPQEKYLKNLIIILLNAIVFITHPPTGIFLYIGITSLNFSFNNYSVKQCIVKSSVLIIPSFLLCLLWPYFNIIDLLVGNNVDINRVNRALFSRVISINWPLLLIIPGLFIVKRNKIYYFFLIAIILMAMVFVGGYILNINGLSRLISNIMMFTQFLIAYLVVQLIKERVTFGKIYLTAISIAFLISLFINFQSIKNSSYYRLLSKKNIEYYSKYEFLRNLVQPDAIILSDENSNWIIPSFNGKVIASKHAICWIDDINERRDAVKSFFYEANPDILRQDIIQKYHPDFLLIDYSKVHFKDSTRQWIKSIGYTLYYKDKLELILIK